jgi:hypothetical protein
VGEFVSSSKNLLDINSTLESQLLSCTTQKSCTLYHSLASTCQVFPSRHSPLLWHYLNSWSHTMNATCNFFSRPNTASQICIWMFQLFLVRRHREKACKSPFNFTSSESKSNVRVLFANGFNVPGLLGRMRLNYILSNLRFQPRILARENKFCSVIATSGQMFVVIICQDVNYTRPVPTHHPKN